MRLFEREALEFNADYGSLEELSAQRKGESEDAILKMPSYGGWRNGNGYAILLSHVQKALDEKALCPECDLSESDGPICGIGAKSVFDSSCLQRKRGDLPFGERQRCSEDGLIRLDLDPAGYHRSRLEELAEKSRSVAVANQLELMVLGHITVCFPQPQTDTFRAGILVGQGQSNGGKVLEGNGGAIELLGRTDANAVGERAGIAKEVDEIAVDGGLRGTGCLAEWLSLTR